MAQFRGTVQGSRGGASRLGGKSSGIDTTANGWDMGVRVWGYYNEEKDRDEFTIKLNSGSGYGNASRRLGTYYRDGDKFTLV